jgi:uncharacterized membrane protein YoaK (UPF0700 family)
MLSFIAGTIIGAVAALWFHDDAADWEDDL